MYNDNCICIETMAMCFSTMSVISEFTSPIMSSTSQFINPIMSSTSEVINPIMDSTPEFTSLTRSSIVSETPGSPLSSITSETNIFTTSMITISFPESNNVMSSISTTSLMSSISDTMHSMIYSEFTNPTMGSTSESTNPIMSSTSEGEFFS